MTNCAKGEESSYCGNQLVSRVLEKLLPFASDDVIKRFMTSLADDLRRVATDPFASHILQLLLNMATFQVGFRTRLLGHTPLGRLYQLHISLEQNLTIRSHDGGKKGHFCHCGDTSIHLPLTRSAQPLGQLSLYLLNEFNSL